MSVISGPELQGPGHAGARGPMPAAGPSRRAAGTALTDLHMAILRAFHAQRALLRPYGARLGLGPGQPKLLSYLAARGTSSQRDIASFFGINAAAVSRMLDALERGGFVSVRPDPQDRRAKAVSLTARGDEAAALWDERCAVVEEEMLAGFSSQERAQLMGMLARVSANLEGGPRA